ncbi:hypothetical protein QQS21_004923 [Conoideocrella luteorostrata]|uniref:Uncharacterized protein n=1 Tax=Conoideocrella luteorostrata TaxID=1105319 RepID=A0AAJ0CUM9_9HYPO|nr:hypothetical protein QQS21_004923 [Conoideocrella luteorostrata]
MPHITNIMLNAQHETYCVGITTKCKYFHVNGSFIKRSLRPSEWQHNPFAGILRIPRFGSECIVNEAVTLRFIADKTNIPVTKRYGCFEDDDAVYLVMEYAEGATMTTLDPE